MIITKQQQEIQDTIFHKHNEPYGCPENFWVRALFASEVEEIVLKHTNDIENTICVSPEYEALLRFRKYLLSLDGYGFRWDFFEIQSHKEWFLFMEVEELLDVFGISDKNNWESEREYYFALFQAIEDKLEEKGVHLGFGSLFELGI